MSQTRPDASLETLRLVATALDVDVHDLFEDLQDNDRREEIMDLDAARADQTRRRDTMSILYKRATVLGFIIMAALGVPAAPGPHHDQGRT